MTDPYRDSPFATELHAKDEIIVFQYEQLYRKEKLSKENYQLYRDEILENSRLRTRLARFESAYYYTKFAAVTATCVMAMSYGFDSVPWNVRSVDSESVGESSGYTQPMFVDSSSSSYMYDIEITLVEEPYPTCVEPFVMPRPVRDPLKGRLRPFKDVSASWPMPTATTKPPLVLVEYSVSSCPP